MTGPGGAGPDLDELARLAAAATPGPWSTDVDPSVGVTYPTVVQDESGRGIGYDMLAEADATFIAAANPAVVAALVERVRAAEAARSKFDERLADLQAEIAIREEVQDRRRKLIERDRDDALRIAERHRAENEQLRAEVADMRDRIAAHCEERDEALDDAATNRADFDAAEAERDAARAELAGAHQLIVDVKVVADRLWTAEDSTHDAELIGELRAAFAASRPLSLADTEQAEPETMRWTLAGRMDEPAAKVLAEVAQQIVAWVNANGGEARYVQGSDATSIAVGRDASRIAIRQADGTEDYAYAGDEVVKGGRWFESVRPDRGNATREFTVRRAADTDGAET